MPNSPTPHSSTSTKDKDSQATRILLIIKALINGKDLKALSEKDFDFKVSKRTFQRDIKMIKDFFSENAALQGGGGLQSPFKSSLRLAA